jgi:hypothetical protein
VRRTESRQWPRSAAKLETGGDSFPAPEVAAAERITRRQLIGQGAGALAAGALAALAWPRPARALLAPEVSALLERSGFVYVSPLKSDGSESRCHGEVWYGWLDADVVLITSGTSWKARALAAGLARTRIWVGDHGRVGRMLGSNDAFRKAPSFEASGRRSEDAALLDRLMATFRRKYPNEIGSWESRMRSGFESGERILIRYTPV